MATATLSDLRADARLLGLLLATPIATGLALRLAPGLPELARQLVPLGLQPGPADLGQAFGLIASNLKAVALPLLGALALVASQHQPKTRKQLRAALDVLLGLSVVSNVALLILATAGYGPVRLAPWLPHLPFEFTAMVLALGGYRRARHAEISHHQLAGRAGAAIALVALAAVLETFATPHV
jgi:hypothetical protein